MTSILKNLPGTITSFGDTGSSPDVLFTCTSLAAGAGRQSAGFNTGTAAKPLLFEWRGFFQSATTPVLGETVDIYIKTANSGNTHLDNDDGTGDIAVSAVAKLNNLRRIGSIAVDEAVADIEFSKSGFITLASRYIHVVFWNATADAFTSTASEHGFTLQAMEPQGQDT